MRMHLRILYGADDRFQLARQTVDVSQGYFHSIKIINTGPSELSKKFTDLPPEASIETLNFFFGDLESARNAMLYDVDVGDYVLWLDSDERPTQLLLDNIERIIYELESTQIYSGRVPGWNHLWNDQGQQLCEDWSYEISDRFPIDAEDYGIKHHKQMSGKSNIVPVPTIGRIVKKLHPFTSAATNFGGHGNIFNRKNDITMRIVMYPIVHLKHDIMVYQSAATCTYVNPCLNAPIFNGYKPYTNSIEFKKLRAFQIETGVKTQNDLCWKLHIQLDVDFKQKLKLLFSCEEFKNSTLYDNFFKHYHIWAERYDLSWKTPPTFCGKLCCRYKNIQL